MRKARYLLKEVPRLLYRYRRKLPESTMWAIADTARALKVSVKAGDDLEGLEALTERLERQVDAHLPTDDWRDYVETLVLALIIALFIRTFLFEAFKIPSGSMVPTLLVGDHIFVSKFIYGVTLPFTETRLFTYRAPRRGEVVVFANPTPGDKQGIDYIKRIMAVAGDRIRMENNIWYVNSEPTKTRILARHWTCMLGPGETCRWRHNRHRGLRRFQDGCPCTFSEESLGDQRWFTQHVSPGVTCTCEGVEHRPGSSANSGVWPGLRAKRALLEGWNHSGLEWQRRLPDGTLQMEVPPGYVFVMGDSRDDSEDSRKWGLVPENHIKGKAFFIWWASQNRWDRVGRQVH